MRSVGTVSLRPGWADGRPTTLGYLGDLRIAFDRVVSRMWRKLFAEIVTRAPEIEELADCTHWFTAVIDENRAALAALTPAASLPPGRRRSSQPVLVPIGPFTMRNLIMRLPVAGRSQPGGAWELGEARAQDLPALTAFFEQENQRMPLGFRGELARRLSRWDGLSISDFVYAADDQGLLACVAPWSPGAAKQTVVSRVPATFRLLGRAARLLPSPPVRVPESGEPLRLLYLTHLTFAARLAARDARCGLPEHAPSPVRSLARGRLARGCPVRFPRLEPRPGAAWVRAADRAHYRLRGACRRGAHTEPGAVQPAGPPAFEMAMV